MSFRYLWHSQGFCCSIDGNLTDVVVFGISVLISINSVAKISDEGKLRYAEYSDLEKV